MSYKYQVYRTLWLQKNDDKLIAINKIPTACVNDTISKPRIIVGIDPGIVHLGLAWVEFCDLKIVCKGASCVNLKEACDPSLHKNVPYSLCKLGHSSHLHDRICHFFQEWQEMFEQADLILVEAQPFKSAGYPFELMMRHVWGSKCTFVAPQTLHAYFGTGKLSYDDRKDKNEELVEAWLGEHGATRLWDTIKAERRQHDCADAFLLIKHYLDPFMLTPKPKIIVKSRFFYTNDCQDFDSFLEKFRYKKEQ